jgi:hypothetical protein
MGQLKKLIDIPRYDQQILGRLLAMASKSYCYESDLVWSTILPHLLKHYSENDLREIFEDKWKHYYTNAQMFEMICHKAKSKLGGQVSKDIEKNISKEEYLQFINECDKITPMTRLDFFYFVTQLMKNSILYDYTITNKDYDESQNQNPKLEYDIRKEAFKKKMQEQHQFANRESSESEE